MSRFAKLAWALLAYNLLVVVWGAYVRASGSGAGCGAHWPLCNGEVIPHEAATKTLVELSHRVTSGLVLVAAIALAVLAFRLFPKGSPIRRASTMVVVLTVVEALIGAGLVLFELVAHDASMKRALSMSFHLVNTFFLLGALTLNVHFASGGSPFARKGSSVFLRSLLVMSGAGLLLVGMSGGVAALGDTLFPATSFKHGLEQELSTGAHILLRLRVLHPLLAITVALLVAVTGAAARSLRPTPGVHRWSRVVTAIVLVQLALGVVNVGLLAPIWLQLVHLLVADLLWIAFVKMWAHARSEAVSWGLAGPLHAGPSRSPQS